MTSRIRIIVATLIAVTATAFLVVGQTPAGRLHNTISFSAEVHDPARAPISGATVELTPVGVDDASFVTKTDARGAFIFYGLPSPRYELTIRYPGFKSFSRSLSGLVGIYIGLGEVIMEAMPYSEQYPLTNSINGSRSDTGGARAQPMLPNTQTEAIETTLCDIVATPQRFNGTNVKFRANISPLGRDRRSVLYSPQSARDTCFIDVFFAISNAPSAEAFLRQEFFSTKRNAVEATISGEVVLIPSAHPFVQIRLRAVSNAVEKQKSRIVWVSGRLVDRTGNPIPGETVGLTVRNPPIADDMHIPQSDSEGNFTIVAAAPGRFIFEVPGFRFHKLINLYVGRNINFGNIILEPVR